MSQNSLSNSINPPVAKPNLSDLGNLCTLGMMQSEVNIGGFNFLLKTLTAKEQEDCLSAVSNYNLATLAFAAALQTHTLALAIVSVNGIALTNLPSAPKDLKDVEAKVAVVGSFQDGLKRKLYEAYQQLIQKSEDVIKDASPESLKA